MTPSVDVNGYRSLAVQLANYPYYTTISGMMSSILQYFFEITEVKPLMLPALNPYITHHANALCFFGFAQPVRSNPRAPTINITSFVGDISCASGCASGVITIISTIISIMLAWRAGGR